MALDQLGGFIGRLVVFIDDKDQIGDLLCRYIFQFLTIPAVKDLDRIGRQVLTFGGDRLIEIVDAVSDVGDLVGRIRFDQKADQIFQKR